MKTKTCNACGINQSVYNFNTKPGRNGKRYYKSLCKLCQSLRAKNKNAAIKAMPKIVKKYKFCNSCSSNKTSSNFTKNIYQIDGLSKSCKRCQSKYYTDNRERLLNNNLRSQQKHKSKNNLRKMLWAIKNKLKVRKTNQLYYKKNIDKITEYNQKWVKKNVLANRNKGHRYRARKKNNTIQQFTKQQLEQRMSIFGFRCAYCGGSFDHIDHVIPLSKGGKHCLSNLRPACKKCNQEKHNKSLSEWLFKKK